MADRSISELVRAACAGDEQAWHEIVDRHARLVWSIARSHRLDDADAGDVFQSTWLRLVENLHRLEQPDQLASWLVTTARRECLRLIKRRDREIPGADATQGEDRIDPTATPPDAAVVRQEEHAQVAAAYHRLPPRCQSLLRLCLADPPLPYAQIAEILEIPLGSIGPQRQRCLARLRQLLSSDDHTDIRAGDV
ncbi:sigma-70 family RNA polymerase sigma factor [Actinobacteria bacterium YIM 96077]|uniref:Sigma-70 family RNA polymerase sigma factor n=1 Tax=Phytoactinopolyspora halophila TaxID=1981511 RepID=A0A329QJE6_9ACTN|nr:sigma-70 family RNA polymerase sigma factor [Phytoactinopolyspora halophila]AYY13501.1 sigma-70 family RNA polymerase sigma factor [Actinobacteria bacterium YIM 96077]RAW12444.1 sigma-70 family RNA polymerase sigma factor [Phytoactinopolyspora halophila]